MNVKKLLSSDPEHSNTHSSNEDNKKYDRNEENHEEKNRQTEKLSLNALPDPDCSQKLTIHLRHRGKKENMDKICLKKLKIFSGPKYQDRQINIVDKLLNENNVDASSYSNFEPASSFGCCQDQLQDPSFIPGVDQVPIQEVTIHETENNYLTLFDGAFAFVGPSHFICDECKEVFKYEYDLANHICELTKENSNEVLKPIFSKENNPERFQINQTIKIPKNCDEGVETQAQESVAIQRSIPTKKRPPYNMCGKRLSSVNQLLKHEKSCAVSSEDKLYICDYCDKSFKYKCRLALHHLIHTDEKPHKCDKCGKSFSTKRYLKKHDKGCGSTDKKYACEECHKKYRQKKNLQTHYRIDTGERPYECKKCGKSYSDPGTFSRHKKSCGCSEDDRPYSCDKCNKKFTRKDSLLNHSQIHNDVMLYQCEKCGQRFSTRLYLRRHKKNCVDAL